MVTLTLFPILQRSIPESYQARAQPALVLATAASGPPATRTQLSICCCFLKAFVRAFSTKNARSGGLFGCGQAPNAMVAVLVPLVGQPRSQLDPLVNSFLQCAPRHWPCNMQCVLQKSNTWLEITSMLLNYLEKRFRMSGHINDFVVAAVLYVAVFGPAQLCPAPDARAACVPVQVL